MSESKDYHKFSTVYLLKTFFSAIPALTLPVIIVGGIVGGIFTPTEAASVAVITGLFISLFIYREIKFKDLPQIILRAATIASTVMLIIATANIFSWFIASQQIPQKISEFMLGFSDSKLWFLMNVNILLILIGMFMESISAILNSCTCINASGYCVRGRSSSLWINYNFEFINWNGHASLWNNSVCS